MIKRINAAKGVKHTLLASAIGAAPALVSSGSFVSAEGLNAQFTLGQRLEYVDQTGVAATAEEGFITRTDLGLAINSQTRNQTFDFSINTGLNYRLTDNNTLRDRVDLDDLRGQFSYKIENNNSVFSFDGSYRRTELDENTFIFDEDATVDDEITTGGGRREVYSLGTDLSVGVDAPVRLDLNYRYGETNYSGTTDADLVDTETNAASARVTFVINPSLTANIFASVNDLDAADVGASDRKNERFGIGASYAISPALTVTSQLSYGKIVSDDNAGTVTKTEGLGYALGVRYQVQNGTLTANFNEEETVNGKRRQITFGRNYAFKRGELAFQLGTTKTDGLDAGIIASLTASTQLSETSSLDVVLNRSSAISDDNETTINTRLSLTYAKELTELSSLSAGLQLSDRSVQSVGGEDQTAIQLNLSHRYLLGRDWNLVSGYSYVKTNRQTLADTSSSTIFVGLEKKFDFRP